MMLSYYKKNSVVIFLLLFFSFFLTSSFLAQSSNKNPKKELENKKKRINDEIKEINSILSKTKANKKSSIGNLVTINLRLQKRQDLINTISAELKSVESDIFQNENKQIQLKNNLIKLKKEYARMLVFAQRNKDAYSTLMFIFSSFDFNQAYSRLKYMQQYSEYRKKQAIEIISIQKQISFDIMELNEQLHQKNLLLGNEEEEKQVLKSEKKEQEQVLTELQKKEKQLKAELQKKKQAALQLQLDIKKLIEEEVRRKSEEAAKQFAKQKEQKTNVIKKTIEEQKKLNSTETKIIPAPKSDKIENIPKEIIKPEKKENLFVPVLTEEAEALSIDFESNRGKLPWPVAKGIICEPYGEHEHPAIKGFMILNSGIEICAIKGMQVRAVFEGEVTSIAVSPTGGKLVIIRHGEYLSVYCNLAEVFVKTGQKVMLKQSIGIIMHDEDEGKTSMNLQIWKGQKTMDPSAWLFNAR